MATTARTQRLAYLTAGWILLIVGVVLTPAPVPVPLIGLLPLLIGAAILSRHSKSFRRGFQNIRHRFAFVSRFLEQRANRFPEGVKLMLRKTSPLAIVRRARMRARGKAKRK